jgi:hypothetical protein
MSNIAAGTTTLNKENVQDLNIKIKRVNGYVASTMLNNPFSCQLYIVRAYQVWRQLKFARLQNDLSHENIKTENYIVSPAVSLQFIRQQQRSYDARLKSISSSRAK